VAARAHPPPLERSRGDPYYKLFAKGVNFQVASHRTATLAKVYGKK
jgi:hypothetical protein